ncbi:hypothetical protein CDAR_211221 [Caerostris darwini]|uniref:Uncharacterized protein n=1 Tax=Caerostris darwini TaxID=1538125 RepID=A0AAV4T915_9ARAC|nr:hypothetical protein CDAR_211221 [Caerostris darwini]
MEINVELRSHKMMSPPSRHAGSETVERIREESIYHFQQDCLEKTSGIRFCKCISNLESRQAPNDRASSIQGVLCSFL